MTTPNERRGLYPYEIYIARMQCTSSGPTLCLKNPCNELAPSESFSSYRFQKKEKFCGPTTTKIIQVNKITLLSISNMTVNLQKTNKQIPQARCGLECTKLIATDIVHELSTEKKTRNESSVRLKEPTNSTHMTPGPQIKHRQTRVGQTWLDLHIIIVYEKPMQASQ